MQYHNSSRIRGTVLIQVLILLIVLAITMIALYTTLQNQSEQNDFLANTLVVGYAAEMGLSRAKLMVAKHSSRDDTTPTNNENWLRKWAGTMSGSASGNNSVFSPNVPTAMRAVIWEDGNNYFDTNDGAGNQTRVRVFVLDPAPNSYTAPDQGFENWFIIVARANRLYPDGTEDSEAYSYAMAARPLDSFSRWLLCADNTQIFTNYDTFRGGPVHFNGNGIFGWGSGWLAGHHVQFDKKFSVSGYLGYDKQYYQSWSPTYMPDPETWTDPATGITHPAGYCHSNRDTVVYKDGVEAGVPDVEMPNLSALQNQIQELDQTQYSSSDPYDRSDPANPVLTDPETWSGKTIIYDMKNEKFRNWVSAKLGESGIAYAANQNDHLKVKMVFKADSVDGPRYERQIQVQSASGGSWYTLTDEVTQDNFHNKSLYINQTDGSTMVEGSMCGRMTMITTAGLEITGILRYTDEEGEPQKSLYDVDASGNKTESNSWDPVKKQWTDTGNWSDATKYYYGDRPGWSEQTASDGSKFNPCLGIIANGNVRWDDPDPSSNNDNLEINAYLYTINGNMMANHGSANDPNLCLLGGFAVKSWIDTVHGFNVGTWKYDQNLRYNPPPNFPLCNVPAFTNWQEVVTTDNGDGTYTLSSCKMISDLANANNGW